MLRQKLNKNTLEVNNEIVQEIKNIATKAYYPLKGFLNEENFYSVLDKMRLKNGKIWSMPVTLDINNDEYKRLKNSHSILLIDRGGKKLAVLKNAKIYTYDKKYYARKIFGTTDTHHPGVFNVLKKKNYLLGGDITYLGDNVRHESDHYYTPTETKKIFRNKGWETVVAFQTRNVPHRSHEYIQKHALKKVDGLFVQPVIGEKKKGDFKDDVILTSYKIILEKYYPSNRYFLGILPIKMNYAGPREAIMHALIRKNFGCTHMIIGRDHAGVGNYYDPYAAQNIFDNFNEKELGITILKYQNVSYCNACKKLISADMCNHHDSKKIFLSGTIIRNIIKNRKSLPSQFTRPEVSHFLLKHSKPFVE